MSKAELGSFEDDPRSIAGAEALDWLLAQTQEKSVTQTQEKWGLEPDLDPRVVATQAVVRDERRFEAYRQREAWVLKPGVEVNLSEATH